MQNCHILFRPLIFKICVLYKICLLDIKYFWTMGILISKIIFMKRIYLWVMCIYISGYTEILSVSFNEKGFIFNIYFFLYCLNGIRCNCIFFLMIKVNCIFKCRISYLSKYSKYLCEEKKKIILIYLLSLNVFLDFEN